MASWDGNSGGGDQTVRPSSSSVLLSSPDSEEHVISQTEDIFRNFLRETYSHNAGDESEEYDSIRSVPELMCNTSDQESDSAQIGRQLARIGDDINVRYASEFDNIISKMNINEEGVAYEAFKGVARKIFKQGINWGRVVSLLFFGYRLAVRVVSAQKTNAAAFLTKIGKCVVKVLISEKIIAWIARQGGWIASLRFDTSINTKTFLSILGFAAMSIAAVYLIKKYS